MHRGDAEGGTDVLRVQSRGRVSSEKLAPVGLRWDLGIVLADEEVLI